MTETCETDSPTVRAHYAPGEEWTRDNIRRYGYVRCLVAAAHVDIYSGPEEVSDHYEYEEVAEVVNVRRWMDDEELARALGIDVDAVIAADDGGLEEAIAVRAAAVKSQFPPAGLPRVLSSVADVGAVCEAAGLTLRGQCTDMWEDQDVNVACSMRSGQVTLVAGIDSASWLATVELGGPAIVLWHAIQAARTDGDPDA